MNESGRSVSAVMRFFKIEPAQMLVVHDELDLRRVRLKRGGGTAATTASGHSASARHEGLLAPAIGIGHPATRTSCRLRAHEGQARRAGRHRPGVRTQPRPVAELATGRMQDAMTWLHTDPAVEAKRREAKEARERERALKANETGKDET
jgi:PTH1 family peptidyl-tRNA hydrolase